jgi:RHS repeat-associated protein
VGGIVDATGLVHLGAREYDPGLGRFISVDPIQDMADPQQWNAYAYAGSNPASFADPAGTMVPREDPGGSSSSESACTGMCASYSSFYYGLNTLRHNAAVRAATRVLQVQVTLMGGNPAKVISEFTVKGGSKELTGNDGRADIVYIDDKTKTVYVWEVKSTGVGAAQAAAEVQHYMGYLKKDPALAGYNVKPGFAMLGFGFEPVTGSAEWVMAYPGGQPGAILYNTFTPPKTVPVPVPVPDPKPVTEPKPIQPPPLVPVTADQPVRVPNPTPGPCGGPLACPKPGYVGGPAIAYSGPSATTVIWVVAGVTVAGICIFATAGVCGVVLGTGALVGGTELAATS